MTDHTATVQGLAAGVGGAVLALLGVDAQQLTAALIACALGALWTPPVSRWQAVALFLAAVAATAIAASLGGPILAAIWPSSWPPVSAAVWGKVTALAVGIWLHPLIQAGAAAVPRLIGAGVSRVERKSGGSQQ